MAPAEDVAADISVGLDRAPFDTYDATASHQQDGHLQNSLAENDQKSDELPRSAGGHVVSKIRHLKEKVQSKLHKESDSKGFLHSNQRIAEEGDTAPTLAPPATTTRDDDRFYQPLPEKPSGPSLKEVASHPLKTIKSAAGRQGGTAYAENLAKTDVAHGANVNMVRALDTLANSSSAEQKTVAIQDLEQLKKSRQDSFVRWTMDRHVQKVRRVEAIQLPRRSRRDFHDKDNHGRQRMQWKAYGDYVRSPVFALYQDVQPACMLNQAKAPFHCSTAYC
jgi:hypothetical protein